MSGFEKMHASPQVITSAMTLYFTGERFRGVSRFLNLQGVKFSQQSVWNWDSKYTKLTGDYLEQIRPQLSDTWRTDEMHVKFKGNMRHLFGMMDDETRFRIAQQVSTYKGTSDVRPMFREAAEKAGKRPKVLISDGAHNFAIATRKEWFSHYRGESTVHVADIRMSGRIHNNIYDELKGCCHLSPYYFHQEAGTHLFEDLPHIPYSPPRGALPTQDDEDSYPHVVVQGDSSS